MPMPNEIINRVHALARWGHTACHLTLANQYAPDDDDEDNDEEYLPNDEYPNYDEDDDLIYDANVIEVNDDDNNNAHNYDPMHHAHNNDDPHVPAGVGNAAMPNNNANMVIMAPNNNANMVIVALTIATPPEAIILAIALPPAAVILAIALPLPPAAMILAIVPLPPPEVAVLPPEVGMPPLDFAAPLATPLVNAAAPVQVLQVAMAMPPEDIGQPATKAGVNARATTAKLANKMDLKYSQPNTRYDLWQCNTRSNSHLHNSLGQILTQERRPDIKPKCPQDFALFHNTLHGTILTQYSVKKGLEIFGEIGEEALTQELKQVHDMDVFNQKDPCKMTCEEKKQALEYLIFLKQKKSRRVKVHGCADGPKQRKYMNKEETSSPMVATESLLLTCIINAEEEHDVATVNLPGAFMQAGMNDVVHMQVAGKMAEILVKIDPKKYGPHVTIEQGKTVLYMQLNKALYRMIQAVLLFWRLLSSKLQEWGFTINLYNWCVTNMMICGRQCTVA